MKSEDMDEEIIIHLPEVTISRNSTYTPPVYSNEVTIEKVNQLPALSNTQNKNQIPVNGNITTETIKQLPELTLIQNQMQIHPGTSKKNTRKKINVRNPYITKWYVLFDNKSDCWISYQPKIGDSVYPCYACRDIFRRRNSFVDHVNRRGLVLKYLCNICEVLKIFYNTCSFLLHCRDHFTEVGGEIDLDNVDISVIDMNLVGFLPSPNIPMLYDTSDDTIDNNLELPEIFYEPNSECLGERFVNFKPNYYAFYYKSDTNYNFKQHNKELLLLKQVNMFIPKCIFVSATSSNSNPMNLVTTAEKILNPVSDNVSSDIVILDSDDSDILCLDDFETKKVKPQLNVPSKLKKQLPNLISLVICSECNEQQDAMLNHFQEITLPIKDLYKCITCELICTSVCSLKAHIRIHDKKPPYTCPECGGNCESWDQLELHMDNVCFHTAKNVRYKCPAKKCTRVFAQNISFDAHFSAAHFKARIACDTCSEQFVHESDFKKHVHTSLVEINECTVCSSTTTDIRKHVLEHAQNCRIFVFICRFCRSTYRSKQTYAVHISKCTTLLLKGSATKKIKQNEVESDMKCIVYKFCSSCNSNVRFNCTYSEIKSASYRCPQCSTPFLIKQTVDNSNNIVPKNIETQSQKLENKDEQIMNQEEQKCNYDNQDVELNTLNIADPLDLLKIKRNRKRLIDGTLKRNTNDSKNILATPKSSYSKYTCLLCQYKYKSKKLFHQHIRKHKYILTSYQCMECGKCFVLKAFFIKHLQKYHMIENVDSYMEKNDCINKNTVKPLQETMRIGLEEAKGPFAETQCKVCEQIFPSQQLLDKHFKIHGLAFLMEKIMKKNHL